MPSTFRVGPSFAGDRRTRRSIRPVRAEKEFSQTQKVTLDGSVQARPYENLSEEELREALACMSDEEDSE